MSACFLPVLPTGGGGASAPTPPPGEATVWDPVMEWADLATIPGPLRDGDFCLVLDTDGGGSVGYAVYSDGASEWQLFIGIFATVTLMLDFPEPVAAGAQATASGNAYVWHTFDSADTPDGVERSEWLPPQIASASPVLEAYSVGSESNVQLAVQGYTVTETGGGSSVASVSGEHVLTAGSGAGNTAILNALDTITDSTKVYMRAGLRANTTGTKGVQLADSTNGQRFYQISGGVFQLYDFVGSSPVITGTVIRSSGQALPGLAIAHDVVEIDDEGRTVLTRITVNGAPYYATKRNVVVAGFNRAAWLSIVNGVLGVKNSLVVTYA